jgi:hypothetical protein
MSIVSPVLFLLAAFSLTLLFSFTVFAQSLRVEANAEWTPTGVRLLPGDNLGIVAEGRWFNSLPRDNGTSPLGGKPFPGTVMSDVPLGALIGRIGDSGAPFVVGDKFDQPVGQAGELYLTMNDVPGTYADNSGFMRVTITARPNPIMMPDFRGKPVREALSFFEQLKRPQPSLEIIPSNLSKDLVVRQDPPPETDIRTVDNPTVWVSDGSLVPTPTKTPATPTPTVPPPPISTPTPGIFEDFPKNVPWWVILITCVVGTGVVGSAAWALTRPSTPENGSGNGSPVVPDVDARVSLKDGQSSTRGLSFTLPEIQLSVDLVSGKTVFDRGVPIIREEVINE